MPPPTAPPPSAPPVVAPMGALQSTTPFIGGYAQASPGMYSQNYSQSCAPNAAPMPSGLAAPTMACPSMPSSFSAAPMNVTSMPMPYPSMPEPGQLPGQLP